MAKKKDIEYLPGWRWVEKGEEVWETRTGKISRAKHAVNIKTGEVLSVRDAQTKQKATRGYERKEGVEKRQYKRRTKIRSEEYSGKFGKTIRYIFRDLEDAYVFVRLAKSIPDSYVYAIVQVENPLHYKGISPRLRAIMGEHGETERLKNANISGYEDIKDSLEESDIPWERMAQNLEDFIMDEKSRIILYASEL